MKKFFGLFIVAIVLSSCTSSIEPIDPNLDPDLLRPAFTADLDGVFNDFTSTVQAERSDEDFIIESTGSPSLGIQVFEPAVGSFPVDPDNTDAGALLFYSDGSSNVFVPVTGTVNITSYDTNSNLVSGNFQGLMNEESDNVSPIFITNGIFEDITMTVLVSPDAGTATIDGNSFDATTFASVELNNQLSITFSNDQNEQISLSFPLNVTAGTYPIEASGGTYTGSYTNAGSTFNAVAGTGDITITSVTNNVFVGTFNFTAEDPANTGTTVSITSGAFSYDNN